MSAAMPDMLELHYELESKAAKWYATIDTANAFFSIPLAAECRPQFAFTWRGIQYTWNRLPQGWKHSPTIGHGLIQAALEQGEAPEHLQYIDDIIVWGTSAEEVSEKGKKIIQIFLKAGFTIKQTREEEEEEEERFDQEASPSAKKWEEGVREIRQEAETTRSLTSSELRDMQKDYSCQPGEQIAAWLLRYWDNGADSQQLEGKWTTADEGIQYLRELAVLEVIYSDLDDDEVSKDPEDVECMRAMWRKSLCILGIDYLRRGYFKDPKGYRWAFGIAALEAEEIEPLSTLPGLLEDPSVVGLLRVKEQQVPIATTTVHRWQYHTKRHSLAPIHKLIHQLESQGVISRTHSPFNSPIWPVRKSNGEWRLTVDYHGLNEIMSPMSAAMPDMLELQYELESKAAKWYATIDTANAFFSIPLAAECRPQYPFTWRGVQYTWNRLPQGWKHSPTIGHGLIQAALGKKGEAPEHLQYIDDIIVWGNSAEEVSEKRKKIIQILLKAGFTIK
ncbi:hypothetical protein GRJ2_002840500 [Grus japonensis]|uniref:ribonuclease H n=1 Tax=Grus japonensis TaxID=30415 RepID=A0ABC9Y1Y8_GRUJA